MKDTKFDRKKVIEEMEALKSKRIYEIKKDIIGRDELEADENALNKAVTIKYLGKMEFINEQGELVDKDVFISVEEHSGQFQIRYYDEDQKLLGIQRAFDENIIPSGDMIDKLPEEMNKLEKQDIEEAKSLEELKEEQNQEEQQTEEEQQAQQEPQKLPGTEDEDPQLNKTQTNNLKGPKISLNQIVDEEPLRNIIGLDGKYLQIVDADIIRKLIPDIKIPTSQRTIPIEIFPDGTANVIGEDKLQLSKQEGLNSTTEHLTATNEGAIRQESNIETFNITRKGGMHTIAIGFDENGGTPLEAKYGWRDIENPNEITYAELETVHDGPTQQDQDTKEFKEDASDGVNKSETIAREDAERYARAKGLYVFDYYGNQIGYDLETAKQEISEDGRPVDKIINDLDVKTKEPQRPQSLYE